MTDSILALNAGSSSIKFALFDAQPGGPAVTCRGQIEPIGGQALLRTSDAAGALLDECPTGGIDHAGAMDLLLDWLAARDLLRSLIGIGHRVVHGGADRSAPMRLDPALLEDLEKLVPLAPLHQPHNLAAIRGAGRHLPALPQIACFDTAFHASQPQAARCLALPRKFEERGLRRYGFHGISYEYIVSNYAAATGELLPQRLIVAHLGNGASLCAVRDG